MSWDASADVPWFTWRLSSPEDTRLSRRLGRSHSVGATLLQSLLPGTVTVLYGDEVCLMETEPQTNQVSHWVRVGQGQGRVRAGQRAQVRSVTGSGQVKAVTGSGRINGKG